MGIKYLANQFACSTLVIFPLKSNILFYKTFTSKANVVNTAFMQYSHTVADVQEEVKIRDNFTSTLNMINTGHTFAPRQMGLRDEQMR